MVRSTTAARSVILPVCLGAGLAAEALAAAPSPTSEAPIILQPTAHRPMRGRPGRAVTEGAATGIPVSCTFFDGFGTYTLTDLTAAPGSLIPLDGQINPASMPWSSETFFGVADADIMTAAGATAPVGAPLHGLATPTFVVSARGTLATPRNTALGIAGAVRIGSFFPILNDPVVISQDVYISSPSSQPQTTTWWSPLSFVEGTIYDRIFFGGSNLPGELAGFANGQGVTDRFLSLGRSVDGQSVVFYGSAVSPLLRVPTNSWFTIMVHMSNAGYSVWVKTGVTSAVQPPFLDPRMASGQIPPIDGDPVGWVNTYPGRDDDVLTPTVREGVGLARTALGEAVPLLGEFAQAPIFSSATVDGIQYGWGFDDPTNGLFQPSDVFFANFCLSGTSTTSLCTADLNNDSVVNSQDISIILNVFGDPFQAFGPNDLNLDGVIDGGDISIILNQFGPCT